MDIDFTTHILPIILGFIGSSPALGLFIYNLLRVRSERQKLVADAELVKAQRDSEYEQMATRAAQNVITKDVRIEMLEKSIDEFRSRLRAAEDAMEDRDDKIKKLTTQVTELQRQIISLNLDNAQLQKQVAALELEKAQLQQQLNALIQDNAKLRSENVALRGRVNKLETALRDAGLTVPNGGK